MLKIKISEETRYVIIILLALLAVLALMLLMNYLLGGANTSTFIEKEKEKTVILTQTKAGAPQTPPSKSVVSSVRDAIKQGNYSTAYLEIGNVSKTAPEYDELRKMLAEETQRRKAPGVRKETGISPSAPIRYLDESTPRDRGIDALYVYFVDVSGTLMPRFCIQAAAKRPLGISGFVITADNKNIQISAPSVKFENTKGGVAEWYDVPLDRNSYDAVQAIIRAKKTTLTVIGGRGKATRGVTDNEKKGLRQVLNGYVALGGNLNYLQNSKPLLPAQDKH